MLIYKKPSKRKLNLRLCSKITQLVKDEFKTQPQFGWCTFISGISECSQETVLRWKLIKPKELITCNGLDINQDYANKARFHYRISSHSFNLGQRLCCSRPHLHAAAKATTKQLFIRVNWTDLHSLYIFINIYVNCVVEFGWSLDIIHRSHVTFESGRLGWLV